MAWLLYKALGILGYGFCELAFRAHCRGPFVYSYKLGNWLYNKETDLGVFRGYLVCNPRFGVDEFAPKYVEA